TRRVDRDLQLVGGALDLDLRVAGVREALLELLAQLDVLEQELSVLRALCEPARVPRLRVTETEPDGMDLLTHGSSYVVAAGVPAEGARRVRRRGTGCVAPSVPSSKVTWHVRLWMGNARPMGAGWMRLSMGPCPTS